MKRVVLFGLLLLPLTLLAADAQVEKVRAELIKSFPEMAKAAIRPSAASGIYEVDLEGQVVYVSGDGKFLIVGDMIEAKTRQNVTAKRREDNANKILASMPESDMIVIGPQSAKRTITVFTDVDCPYCYKIHQEVPELNKNGVKVRYLLYPRNGIASETYKKSVSVWCAEDRIKAVGVAKSGGKVEAKTCANPVEQHYKLGNRLDVNGTPTIFLDNGKRIGGYIPAAQMLAHLGLKSTAAAPVGTKSN
jgi:thiol:disulfide interchange protein DsbC